MPPPLAATYVLPLRLEDGGAGGNDESDASVLLGYLTVLRTWIDEVLVIDGSPPQRFAVHRRLWGDLVTHLPPDVHTLNGKVGGVITGIGRSRHERVVIADDDVRYDRDTLEAVVSALDGADLVRPQNYFAPVPWHARWDTARVLLNRVTGGDFPGTLAVRRSLLRQAGGYRGDVLFENLELIRTVVAAGGTVHTAHDCYVRRLPPTTRRFLCQRVRQAYDELARPGRLVASLALAPATALLARRHRGRPLALAATASVVAAEVGRRRAGGCRVFPLSCVLFAPLWLLERAVCMWIAVGLRLVRGGCPYRGVPITQAATPVRELRRRVGEHPSQTWRAG